MISRRARIEQRRVMNTRQDAAEDALQMGQSYAPAATNTVTSTGSTGSTYSACVTTERRSRRRPVPEMLVAQMQNRTR